MSISSDAMTVWIQSACNKQEDFQKLL